MILLRGGVGAVGMPRRTSFPASRDGSLKDVGSPATLQPG